MVMFHGALFSILSLVISSFLSYWSSLANYLGQVSSFVSQNNFILHLFYWDGSEIMV